MGGEKSAPRCFETSTPLDFAYKLLFFVLLVPMIAYFCVLGKNSVIIDIIEILAPIVNYYFSAPYPFLSPPERICEVEVFLRNDGNKQNGTVTYSYNP
jgi:hypothetical protein